MFSHSVTCPRCGVVNRFFVAGDVLLSEKIRCSKCPQSLGEWATFRTEAASGESAKPARRQPSPGPAASAGTPRAPA